MPYGSSSQTRSSGEVISHYTGVRMRVTGAGLLRMTFYALDTTVPHELTPFNMNLLTNIEPFRLANYVQQRAFVEIYTEDIDEVFRIRRIILYAKQLYEDYPSALNAL